MRFVFQNPHVLALIFCGLFLSFRKGIQRDNLALLLYLILFFFYPDPLPFFLASLLPIIVLLALLLNKESDWSYFRSIAMAFALMVLFGVRIVALYEHSSFQQQPVAEWLKSNLARPWILVYDPAGLIPANTVEYWFAGPGEAQWARSTVDQIELQKVDVFLYSQKGMYLEPYLSDGLKKNYLQFGKSIYVRFLDFAELREKPCAQQIELVKLKFDRQLSNGQPLFLREFDAINDHYTEIKNVDEDLCKIQLDQSTHGSRSVLMPLQLKYTPKQDFMELFAYDSSF